MCHLLSFLYLKALYQIWLQNGTTSKHFTNVVVCQINALNAKFLLVITLYG